MPWAQDDSFPSFETRPLAPKGVAADCRAAKGDPRRQGTIGAGLAGPGWVPSPRPVGQGEATSASWLDVDPISFEIEADSKDT